MGVRPVSDRDDRLSPAREGTSVLIFGDVPFPFFFIPLSAEAFASSFSGNGTFGYVDVGPFAAFKIH